MLGRRTTAALAAVPIAFFALFFAYPVGCILQRGLMSGGRLNLRVVREVLTDPFIGQIAWFTLWQAVVSTALTLVLGVALAHVLANFEFPARRFVRAFVAIPFVLPTVVVGTAFLVLLGPAGPLGVDLRQTVWAVLIAHVFFNVSVVARTVAGAWATLPTGPEDTARALGAPPWRVFMSVTLPRLTPAIGAAGAIVFLFTFTSFGVVVILGGPGLSTLESETYYQTVRLLNLDTAAVLALVQMAAVVGLLIVQRRLQRSFEQRFGVRGSPRLLRRPVTARERLHVATVVAAAMALVAVPLSVLVVRSLRVGGGWSLGHYDALDEHRRGSTLFVEPLEAVFNSLRFAAAATVIALVIGGFAAVVIARGPGRLVTSLDTALMLPLGTSAATVGFGFLIALDAPPLDLRTSIWIVPIAHAMVGIPFVIRMLVPALRSVDSSVRDAAAMLGAGPAATFRRVELPVIGRSVVVAAGFAFAVSLGEFGATSFIARPQQPTIPTAIFRFLGQPGATNFGLAMAMSVVLLTLSGAVLLAVDRFRLGALDQW